ncbi:unnamed protein product [Prorocentrum cordatum]|uniref:Uncharacterized protein n=1 Tax=Prorocentrum cordatum TaxID=2364126 RepID=A0ABN9RFU8_9DINO|nr:unnamed protein product [Polarella glacialis]
MVYCAVLGGEAAPPPPCTRPEICGCGKARAAPTRAGREASKAEEAPTAYRGPSYQQPCLCPGAPPRGFGCNGEGEPGRAEAEKAP